MPLIPRSVIEELAASFAAGRRPVAACDVDPLELARAAETTFGPVRFFSDPQGEATVGLGTAERFVATGADRFGRLRGALEGLAPHRRALVGFSFSDAGPTDGAWAGFAAAEAVLPVVALATRRDGDGWSGTMEVAAEVDDPSAVLAALADLATPAPPRIPDVGDHVVASHPSVTAWRLEVAEAVDAIRSGSLDKVVLARAVTVASARRPLPFDLLAHLASAYPRCYGFGWGSGAATFVGASPELLVSRSGDVVRSNPLAGSARRGEGDVEDRAIGRALMASDKDRVEHAIVVEDVAARLGPYTSHLAVPAEPSLRRMATVQHLSSSIEGRLSGPTHLLDLVGALHPTPAVGGTPREEAVRFIEKVEGIDRGWYTGGVGWVDGSGDGAVAIGLRCGLLGPDRAVVYAGAGIVADSDPDAELVETRLKFRPLLELLAAT